MNRPQALTVVYVHGAGNKPPRDELKRAWDLDLFGRVVPCRPGDEDRAGPRCGVQP